MKIGIILKQVVLITIIIVSFNSCSKKCQIDNLKFQIERKDSKEINFYLKYISYSESDIHATEPSFIFEVHNFSDSIVDLIKELKDVTIQYNDLDWSLDCFEKSDMLLNSGDKIFITMVLTKMIDYDHQLKLIECLKTSINEIEVNYVNDKGVKKEVLKAKDFNMCIQELEN
jgi:hypothetical protein